MLSLDEFSKNTKEKAKIYKDFRLEADKKITNKLTICIPDIHLLERGPNDDFLDNNPEHEEQFISFLDFLLELKESEKDDLEIIQIGDLYDLWQARGNTNLIQEAYTNILGLLDKLGTIYIVGNHDIDLIKWHEDKDEKFRRELRYYSYVDEKLRAIYEHGYQADFANNQGSWSGAMGREITRIVGMMEYIYPNVDSILGDVWGSISRIFSIYNAGLTPVKNPEQFNVHEYLNYYINLMEKYNKGDTDDHLDPTDLVLSVIGHTHSPRLVKKPKNERMYYLMDCGSWVNGGHEFGVISGREMAVCQWGDETKQTIKPKKSDKKAPTARIMRKK